jgi:putative RecB family exonuclease
MTINPRLKPLNEELHISHSQIFAYSNCSLKYRFKYVEQRPAERISIALPFGTAMHSALELFYRTFMKSRQYERIVAIIDRFSTCLELDLENASAPVIYKKEAPDRESVLTLGREMLKAFYETVNMDAYDILAVELPLSATLYTDEGQPTDFKVFGILDLLLREKSGEILVVDNKTAAKPMAQATADDDNQMTAYSYLLASNRYVFPSAEVRCRFDVLRKLKTPKLEHVFTLRTAAHRKRFARIANAVLAGIDGQVFLPQPSWMCGDCAYADACKAW